jgi:hypothetical protein
MGSFPAKLCSPRISRLRRTPGTPRRKPFKFVIPAQQTVLQFAKDVILGQPGADGRDPERRLFKQLTTFPAHGSLPASQNLAKTTNCGTAWQAGMGDPEI